MLAEIFRKFIGSAGDIIGRKYLPIENGIRTTQSVAGRTPSRKMGKAVGGIDFRSKCFIITFAVVRLNLKFNLCCKNRCWQSIWTVTVVSKNMLCCFPWQ